MPRILHAGAHRHVLARDFRPQGLSLVQNLGNHRQVPPPPSRALAVSIRARLLVRMPISHRFCPNLHKEFEP